MVCERIMRKKGNQRLGIFVRSERDGDSSMILEIRKKRAVALVYDKYKNANANEERGEERGFRGPDRKPARRQRRCA